MNGVFFYFVNKLFLVGRYWDFKDQIAQNVESNLRSIPSENAPDFTHSAERDTKCV